MQGPHEANGGPAGAADGRPGQAGRRSAHLPPEHQEGQGQGRGLHQAPRVLHLTPEVGDKNMYKVLKSQCLFTNLSAAVFLVGFCVSGHNKMYFVLFALFNLILHTVDFSY